MSKRIILLLFSDTHAGSEYGLLHPETELSRITSTGDVEEFTHQLSEIQRCLFYDIFQPGVRQAISFAGNDDVIAIHVGDPTQGNKYISEVVTNKMSSEILIAVRNMEEVLQYDNVKKFRMLDSTPSHVYGENSADVLIADALRRSYPDKDIANHYHGEYLIQEVDTLLDVAHHGPSRGIRKWLEGNQFRFYMIDLMMKKMMKKKRVPDILVRAHTHGKLEEYKSLEGNRMWGFITPPMQFPGSWIRQISRSETVVEVGLLLVEIIYYSETRKTIFPYWITKTFDIATKEIL